MIKLKDGHLRKHPVNVHSILQREKTVTFRIDEKPHSLDFTVYEGDLLINKQRFQTPSQENACIDQKSLI